MSHQFAPESDDAPDDLPHDAVLLTSFGGPEGPDEVMPFLRNVVEGRNVPDERLAEVAEHYHARGGVSPINEQNRDLVAELAPALAERGIDLPVLFGNRNWHPLLADTLEQAARDGHRRILALVTSAYSSWSGCRQYREDLARARAEVVDRTGIDLAIDKVRVWFNHPGFVSANADHVVAALGELGDPADEHPPIAFVTHSIPLTMSRHSDYVAQHLETCRLVADRVRALSGWDGDWRLVYCSRSGPPQVPWLEPDVGDHVTSLGNDPSVGGVVVAPIGFVSDHMEVIHDLDVEAAEAAEAAGLAFARAATAGLHPDFVAALVDLVAERELAAPARAMGVMGPWHDACPVDCCRVPGDPERPTVASAPDRRARSA